MDTPEADPFDLLSQRLVWILTVSADGAVPITYRLADGNTNDDPTHVPTWDELVNLLGRSDFLYVADSKLASTTAMGHIDSRGGRFVTVLPRTRKEDNWFRDWAQTHTPDWAEAFHARAAGRGTRRLGLRAVPGQQRQVRGPDPQVHTVIFGQELAPCPPPSSSS